MVAKIQNQSNLSNYQPNILHKSEKATHQKNMGVSQIKKAIQNVESPQAKESLKEKKITKEAKKEAEKSTPEVLAYYEHILNNYLEEKEKKLFKKGDPSPTGLTREILLKVIEVAFSTFQGSVQHTEERSYHINFDSATHEIELTYAGSKIGKGGLGKVYTFNNLIGVLLEDLVVKVAREKFKNFPINHRANLAQRAIIDVENEFKQLIKIHQEGNIWGIQARPLQLVEVYIKGKLKLGYLGIKYAGDYFEEFTKPASFQERLMDFQQLASGLHYLAQHDILHGDLKPENIFVKNTPDGNRLVCIADLGGARDASIPTLASSIRSLSGSEASFTSDYAPLNEIINSGTLVDLINTVQKEIQDLENPEIPYPVSSLGLTREEIIAKKKLLIENTKQELIVLEKARDVFALGTIFYATLTSYMPFLSDKAGHPQVKNYQEIKRTDVPQDIKDLIRQMLDPDPLQRPLAAGVLNRLNHYMKAQQPDIYSKLKRMQQGYLPEKFHFQVDADLKQASLQRQLHYLALQGHVVKSKEEALKVLADAPKGQFVIWESQSLPGTYGFLQKQDLPLDLRQAQRLPLKNPAFNLMTFIEQKL